MKGKVKEKDIMQQDIGEIPHEFWNECLEYLMKAKKIVAKKMADKYGPVVPFVMFLNADIYSAIGTIFECAPSRKAARELIATAMKDVEKNRKGE